MASITIDPKGKTLRKDSLANLGVTIEQIKFRCTTCGEILMTPTPWTTGNFPRNWYECPKGCNSKIASGKAA